MTTDALAPARAAVAAALDGLEPCVTVNVARSRCEGALDALASQLRLLNEFERPRQDRVKAERAQAAAKQAASAAKAAAEKKARIEKRKARRP